MSGWMVGKEMREDAASVDDTNELECLMKLLAIACIANYPEAICVNAVHSMYYIHIAKSTDTPVCASLHGYFFKCMCAIGLKQSDYYSNLNRHLNTRLKIL